MSGFENDVVYAKNADFTQADNQAASEANGLATDGQIWIGSTATNAGGTHINVGSMISPNSSLTFGYSSPNITAQVEATSLVTTYTTGSGTWTINPRTTWVQVYMWGGGAGGGSGRKGTSTQSAGGSAGSGGYGLYAEGPSSLFSGGLSYNVGTGGVGGAAQTADNTNGNPGIAGLSSSLGSLITAQSEAGLGGINNNTAAPGTPLWYTPLGTSNAHPLNGSGGGRVQSGINPTSQIDGAFFTSGSGGGGGGGDSVTPRSGGNAQGLINAAGTTLVAGASGGASTMNGANANASYSSSGLMSGGYGGGGGGGSDGISAGGNGGNGSVPGGGGGGGGGGITALANSGAGGNGADGKIIIVEYF